MIFTLYVRIIIVIKLACLRSFIIFFQPNVGVLSVNDE